MQKFYTKAAEANGEILLAVCDEEIAGKMFEDDRARLTVSKSFYCDKICDEEELVEKLNNATIINLAGNRCVGVAIKQGFVKADRVISIGGVSHAQAVTAKYHNIE